MTVCPSFFAKKGVEGGSFWVWPDKNDPKCDMEFDSDTFSKRKCSKIAEKVQGVCGQKSGKMQHGVRAYD